jgi:hypothetical protein
MRITLKKLVSNAVKVSTPEAGAQRPEQTGASVAFGDVDQQVERA